ncbi:hypothetical protein P9112_009258 [Eukaryota sp. TZLM1-RC]
MPSIFLDVDPGHDDAFAIILAVYHPSSELLGITTVAGNQTVQKTAHNAKRVLHLIGKPDIKVVAGCSGPLTGSLRICDEVHGSSGLDGTSWESIDKNIGSTPSDIVPSPFEAVTFMYNSIKNAHENGKSVHLVATGSLTNVALALKVFPDMPTYIDQLSIMGGAINFGNIAPSAEFNILVDPVAADIVFREGECLGLAMVPLEVTHTALVTEKVLEGMRDQLSNEMFDKIHGLLTFFESTYKEVFKFDSPPLHDPCAVLFSVEPSLFKGKKYHVDIETQGKFTSGRTCVDLFEMSGLEKNCLVCEEMEVESFWQRITDALVVADKNKPQFI